MATHSCNPSTGGQRQDSKGTLASLAETASFREIVCLRSIGREREGEGREKKEGGREREGEREKEGREGRERRDIKGGEGREMRRQGKGEGKKVPWPPCLQESMSNHIPSSSPLSPQQNPQTKHPQPNTNGNPK